MDSFLAQHYDELGGLVDRLFEVRSGGEMTQDELVEWGRRVHPIYEDAKTVIVEANAAWREILTDEQRAIHDEDLRLMTESFATTEDQLRRIITGQMTVDEFRNPPRPRRSSRTDVARAPSSVDGTAPGGTTPTVAADRSSGRRTTAPTGANRTTAANRSGRRDPIGRSVRHDPRSADGEPAVAGEPGGRGRVPSKPGGDSDKVVETKWQAYVRQFIEKYKLLNDDQVERANKILKSCEEQAERYARSRQAEIDRLDRRTAAAAGRQGEGHRRFACEGAGGHLRDASEDHGAG